eukprot:364565-Chlamydomonas_euryale.AAC.3
MRTHGAIGSAAPMASRQSACPRTHTGSFPPGASTAAWRSSVSSRWPALASTTSQSLGPAGSTSTRTATGTAPAGSTSSSTRAPAWSPMHEASSAGTSATPNARDAAPDHATIGCGAPATGKAAFGGTQWRAGWQPGSAVDAYQGLLDGEAFNIPESFGRRLRVFAPGKPTRRQQLQQTAAATVHECVFSGRNGSRPMSYTGKHTHKKSTSPQPVEMCVAVLGPTLHGGPTVAG